MSFPNYNKVSHVFATCFGVGSIPFAPGTWGSFFAVLLIYNIAFLQEWIILATLFTVALSWWVCVEVHKETKSDSSEIVIDEFVGQSIPIILFEIFHGDRDYSAYEALQIYFWFFLLFRVFDGLKPFPIDYVDKKFKNTFGILFDDILAGIYVVLCLILFMVGKTYLLQ